MMLKEPQGNESLSGNSQYTGFCVDLLEKISRMCNFNYTIKLVEDGLHGTQINGKWNGIVRELIDKGCYELFTCECEIFTLKF